MSELTTQEQFWQQLDELLLGVELYKTQTGMPWVTLSYAQSLDGSLAASTNEPGQPLVLSSESSMAMTHRLRAQHQGILVGIGTVLADDPRLTVRLVPGASPQPVVLDSRLRMPLNCRLMQHPKKPWVICAHPADPGRYRTLEDAGARVLPLPLDGQEKLPLRAALALLADAGLGSLMVEGGASVLTSFLRQRLGTCAVITLAPMWVGGLHLSAGSFIEPGSLVEAQLYPRLADMRCTRFGEDLVLWGRLA